MSSNPTPSKVSPVRGAYSPAIEGLRAIAVLSVVFGHALVPGFSGGFVGVDVFFVISGFLICRLLFEELEREGTIRLLKFWTRRMRRLLPNATLTLLVVLLAGLFLVPGYMRKDVATDVAMSALQVSNYYFAAKAVDYFRQDDSQSPVLHFWSLAVEEQFYIIWPASLILLCIVFGRRAQPASRLLLFIVCAASLAGMLKAITLSQPVAFFHSWARAWQLGLGGLLAVAFRAWFSSKPTGFDYFTRLSPLLGVLGWVGLGAVATSIIVLDEGTLYPGFRALPPTLGAAAIVAAVTMGKQPPWGVGSILSAAPLRWIGARSYSWYLWHWPMLIYAEMAFPQIPGVRIIGATAALVVASAVFTLVEDPIRRGNRFPMPARQSVLMGLASILLVLAASAGFARVTPLSDAETTRRNQLITEASKDVGRVYPDKCHLAVEATTQPDCEYGARGGWPRVILFGDSHAAQWFPALDEAASAEGWSLRSWTKSSCPASDIRIWYPPRRSAFQECDAWREAAMIEMTGPNPPDIVVLSNLLDYSGWIENPAVPGELLRKAEAEPLMRAGLERSVQRLVNAGVSVVIVRDTPRILRSFARCYVQSGGSGCGLIRDRALPKPWIDVDVARSFPTAAGVFLLDLTDQICETNLCSVTQGDEVIWQDSHHIRAKAARRLSEHFRILLSEIAKTKTKSW